MPKWSFKMKKYLFFLFAVILVLATLSFTNTSSVAKQVEPTTTILDTADAREIMKTIEKSYEIEMKALYTNDFSKFPMVFINDPRYNINSYLLQAVRELSNNPSLKSAGWLDYKMAYWSWRVNGAIRAEALFAKAKSENRGLTHKEQASLVDSYGRSAPPRHPKEKLEKIYLEFISVNVNGDIATAVLDEGPRTIELTLVRVDEKWYIAASKTLLVNV
jgi:hypothetical protein